jgi:hypothetical protein
MRCSEGEDKKIYRLSSSNASNYIYGHYKARNTQISLDREGKIEDLSDNPLVSYGYDSEKYGVAAFIKKTKVVPKFILKDQDRNRFVVLDWLNLGDKADAIIDISATPDGVIKTHSLLEIKCPDMGNSCFDKEGVDNVFGLPKNGFPIQYLCQLAMQQAVMNMIVNDKNERIYDIKQSYLLAWSPNRTRIWEYKFDSEFRNWIINQLEEYSLCLIDGEKVIPKPKEYKENLINQYNKIKLKWDSAGEKHEN